MRFTKFCAPRHVIFTNFVKQQVVHGSPSYLFSDAFDPTVRIWFTTGHDTEQFFSHYWSDFPLFDGRKFKSSVLITNPAYVGNCRSGSRTETFAQFTALMDSDQFVDGNQICIHAINHIEQQGDHTTASDPGKDRPTECRGHNLISDGKEDIHHAAFFEVQPLPRI